MKITGKKQVNSARTDQSVDLEYSQPRENPAKKREISPLQMVERRKGDRRRSAKARKNITFGVNSILHNLEMGRDTVLVKDVQKSPTSIAQAYKETTETHVNWRFPSHQILKEI